METILITLIVCTGIVKLAEIIADYNIQKSHIKEVILAEIAEEEDEEEDDNDGKEAQA